MKKTTVSLAISIGTLLYGTGVSSVLADQISTHSIENRVENIVLHDAKSASVDAADIWSSIVQAEVSSADMPEPFLADIDTYVFTSSVHKDRQFQISVALPRTYKESEKSYPVLYSLDANSEFGMVVETARLLTLDEAIPELIIVGIGFPVGGRFLFSADYRRLNYTPTELKAQNTGGAPKLLEFMRRQLMPFIEKKYRVNSDDKAIFGHSLGGLFSTYALLRSNGLFQRFIIGSPSLHWDDHVMFKLEKEYATTHTALPAKVFVSAGSKEDQKLIVSHFKKFVKVLKQRNYADLQWTSHIFEGETHISVVPATISRGLRSIYSENSTTTR